MTRNSGKPDKVLWSELLPWEFKRRLADCPLVYLPLGICEPHGQIAAFGLDTIKAEWLCENAAREAGGIVAPAMGYHVHESGYHARWLEDTVGECNPHMTGMPPHVFLHFFLYQLRAFANAGFKGIVVVSGHSGGNQFDLRRVAERFSIYASIPVFVASDPELVTGRYEGDHAGKYEISQLLYVRPDLVDFAKSDLHRFADAGGPLAIGDDAHQADPLLGRDIMEACLRKLIQEAESLKGRIGNDAATIPITYEEIEALWQELWQVRQDWITARPRDGQLPVSTRSQWKSYERLEV
ncbi:creatininase family protein [Cohnella endophytica]|uniref:Creatininase family protein n=1 Tax=Cohnella endophytica TaxID=2419778 RepID=A0A494XLC4_9BACL|nr:creatininase family protein [Cohnella endophytica]RKP48939.1 creatininase family protein [Cohnella endophytica]